MKKLGVPLRSSFTAIALSLLASIFFLSSCGGGGSGTGTETPPTNDPVNELSDFQLAFEAQNTANDRYLGKIQELQRSISDLENQFVTALPTDEDAQLLIDAMEEHIARVNEAYLAGETMIQAEDDLQGRLTTLQQASVGIQSTGIQSAGSALLSVFSKVCTVVSLTSFATSLNDNFDQYSNDLDECHQFLKKWIANMPSGLTLEEKKAYIEKGVKYTEDCAYEANHNLYTADGTASFGLVFGLWGPEAPETTAGQLTTGLTSFLLDSGQLYLWGTMPKEVNTIYVQQMDSKSIIGLNNPIDSLEFFVTTIDSDGTFTAPIGDWNVVIFKNGYARMGNRQGEFLHVSAGETPELIADPIPVDELNEDDLSCEADNGNDPNPPVDDGNSTGSMSGSFGVTCDDGYSDGSDFSVTIASDGSVSGTYDWGNLTGGVQDGFMSLQFDGYWSDCVMGGYVTGSGSTLAGSGSVTCGGGSCYGSWTAGH